MSKDNTQRFKLNIIDVFIIALIVLCIFTVLFRAFALAKEESKTDNYREYIISFKAENVRGSSLKYFIDGDHVRIKSKNKVIGKLFGGITNIEAVGEYTDNGEIFNPDILDNDFNQTTRYNIRGDIIAKGEMTNRGLWLESGIRIAPNNEFLIITEHLEINIRIMSVGLK